MMRTSNLFLLHGRYRKQKPSKVQSTTNGGKALDRAFLSVVDNQEEEKIKSDLWQIGQYQ